MTTAQPLDVQPTPLALLLLGREADPKSERGVECPGDLPAPGSYNVGYEWPGGQRHIGQVTDGTDGELLPGDPWDIYPPGATPLPADIAYLPADNPQFQLLIMLDEPKALPETHGFITSGWNAVPTGGNVIARIAPLLGVEPRFDLPPSDRLILAASRTNQ